MQIGWLNRGGVTVTNSPGYYSGYGQEYAESSPAGAAARAIAQPANALWLAAAVLGSATYGVSFGCPVLLGWSVWFSVLAAVIAAVGLVPRQRTRGWIVVAFAVTGFLNALSTWYYSDEAGWALVVIVVLNALQAAAAVAALILGGDTENAGDSTPDYAAYTQYAQAFQAYQAYAMQYQQGLASQSSAAGQASAQAQGHATAQGRASTGARERAADAAQESYESMHERYAQYGGHPEAPQRDPAAASAMGAGPDPGIPTYGRGPTARQQPGVQQENSGEASN